MKTLYKHLVCFVLAMSFVGVGTAQTNKENRQERLEDQYHGAKELVDQGNFIFRSNWMNTRGGKRIQLDQGSGYLSIEQNKAKAYFPYFGVVRVATMYEGGGIEFDAEMKDYEVRFNDERRLINISFKISGKKEEYEVFIQLHNGLGGSVTVNSNKRDQISYDGQLRMIEH